MAETVIDGWRCYVAGDGIRHAESNGGFTVQLDKHGGLAGDNCYAPPAVVLWLIRPLLHKAWATRVATLEAELTLTRKALAAAEELRGWQTTAPPSVVEAFDAAIAEVRKGEG